MNERTQVGFFTEFQWAPGMDEAQAFDLWYSKQGKSTVLVLYFEARRNNDPIWLAMSQSGTVSHDARALPRGAFNAMWKATQ